MTNANRFKLTAIASPTINDLIEEGRALTPVYRQKCTALPGETVCLDVIGQSDLITGVFYNYYILLDGQYHNETPDFCKVQDLIERTRKLIDVMRDDYRKNG